MKKIFNVLLISLIIPGLAFAAGECKRLTDEEYRNNLISHPRVISFYEDNKKVTVTETFNKDGTGKSSLIFKGYHGSGIIDAEFDWSVNNAVLHTHTTKATHSDTHNKKLNKELDYWMQDALENPDYDEPLDTCEPKKR